MVFVVKTTEWLLIHHAICLAVLALSYQVIFTKIIDQELKEMRGVKEGFEDLLKKFIEARPEINNRDDSDGFDFEHWVDITDHTTILPINPYNNFVAQMEVQFADAQTEQLCRNYIWRMRTRGSEVKWRCNVDDKKIPYFHSSLRPFSSSLTLIDTVLSTLSSIVLLSWLYRTIFDIIHKRRKGLRDEYTVVLIKKMITSAKTEVIHRNP